METRLSRYLLFIFMLLAIGFGVYRYGDMSVHVFNTSSARALLLSLRYQAGVVCRQHSWLMCTDWAGSHPTPPVDYGQQVQLTDLTRPVDTVAINEHHHNPYKYIPACATPTLTEAEQAQRRQNRKRIYSWTDDNGQMHFSDNPRQLASIDITLTQYREPEYSFELTVSSTNGELPLFYKDKLTAAMNKVSEQYQTYLPDTGVEPVRMNLTLAHSHASYQRLQAKYAPTLGPSQGFYVAKNNLAVVWHKDDSQAHQTAIHESVHVLNAGLFGPTPRWFNEGMAEYFEGIKLAGYSAKIPARDWKRILSDQRISLKMLLEQSKQSWAGNQQASLYAQSHSLIHFLMSSKQGKQTLKVLLAYLVETKCETSDPQQALKRYPGGIEQLEHDWVAWINQQQYRQHSF